MSTPPHPGPAPQRPPRWFIAEDILTGRVSLHAYPFRYIYISIRPPGLGAMFGAGVVSTVDSVFTAVEFLETRGWQLVHFEQAGQIAYLRRTGP